MKVAVSGSTGFVGSYLLESLYGFDCIAIGRRKPRGLDSSHFFDASIGVNTDYSAALTNVDVIIHCAARVHVMNDLAENPLEAFREVNTFGTLNLAQQAAESGAKRFIYISSIKVNGEETQLDHPFTAFDQRSPEDAYGQSKSEAEEQLLKLANETGMEVVIIRPPLVYGPGVKANFASLMKLVSKGVPLPFGLIKSNRRSLVSVINLVDLVVTCINHPKAANQVFLVSDNHDLSTAEMVWLMANGLGVGSRMLPVPTFFFSLLGRLFKKEDVINRLIGNLQVDITHTKQQLGWQPPQKVEDAFRETALDFLKNEF